MKINLPTMAEVKESQKGQPIEKQERVSDKKHLKWITSFPCMIPGCYNREIQAHHLLRAEPRGAAYKTSDKWVVPLCSFHHTELHNTGNEISFFARHRYLDYNEVKRHASVLYKMGVDRN